jgi:hypothetical protein
MKVLSLAATAATLSLLVAGNGRAMQLKPPSCGFVSIAKVQSALASPIASSLITTLNTPGVTQCYYASGANIQEAVVAFHARGAAAIYATMKRRAGRAAKPVANLPCPAFSDSSPYFSTTREINMLCGAVEAEIDARAFLPKVKALAEAVAAALTRGVA